MIRIFSSVFSLFLFTKWFTSLLPVLCFQQSHRWQILNSKFSKRSLFISSFSAFFHWDWIKLHFFFPYRCVSSTSTFTLLSFGGKPFSVKAFFNKSDYYISFVIPPACVPCLPCLSSYYTSLLHNFTEPSFELETSITNKTFPFYWFQHCLQNFPDSHRRRTSLYLKTHCFSLSNL